MLTKNEITALSLSPTKKDFVQIWNELLEVAGKLSERWDPTSTNESDPGIVILKALTGIADKLNYNIDKNTLEAFMPTAAQEESMRKLCDMLGYNVKYYRSAETNVTIKYYNTDPTVEEEATISSGLLIPKFTVVTNSDKDISYFTTNQTPYFISSTTPSVTLSCMEGQIVKCESTTDNNVITAAQISDGNRFYLPEAQVAENGIFVYNVYSSDTSLVDGTPWEKVDNLNIQARGSHVFKFGYDSYESRPYIEFPSDYSELINDGLFIYYARTSGANGNVSANTLTKLETPSSWQNISSESFSVENTFAATNGANVETIKQAYNNFKKTVGTFETLVTCRDYMNKIYTMTDDVNRPYVSNALVTDIRNDLNRAVTICSCDDAGIFYKETPLTETTIRTLKLKNSTATVEVEDETPAISHFDLVLYPFKSYTQIRGNVRDIQATYDAAFKYSAQSFNDVKSKLDELNIKTIAHNIVAPRSQDLISINNYLRLNAIIGTNAKITAEEGTLLIESIKIALANAFNMRELDFGEEIPFDSILEVIEKADSRIKVVSLNEPALYTTFSIFEGLDTSGNPVIKEYAVASNDWFTEAEADATGRFDIQKDADGNFTGGTFNTKKAKEIYNKLAVRNVLAGRIPLFKYNNTFKTNFTEGAYRVTETLAEKPELLPVPTAANPVTIYVDGLNIYTGQLKPGAAAPVYTKTYVPEAYANNLITKAATDDNNITEISTSCKILPDEYSTSKHISDVTLSTGEFVRFRAPNFITTKTYPAYVNYHLALNKDLLAEANSADAYSLYSLLNGKTASGTDKWEIVLDYFSSIGHKKTFSLIQNVSKTDTSENRPGFEISNPSASATDETPAKVLARSGCVKLGNNGMPIIKWADGSEGAPAIDTSALQINLENSWFITSESTFGEIKAAVDAYLSTLTPLDKDWTISYEFEYVPFESSTLAEWENLANLKGLELFGFTPAKDADIILWRTYGDSYQKGKYILDNGAKLMPFTSTYFSLLDNLTSRLHGIYVAEALGNDQKANFISNNEEYKLRDREYLFIEYTPSTTLEDGTTQTLDAVKEVHGPGTIIRPTGFETNLIDSSAYADSHSALKTVTFDLPTGGTSDIALFSLGSNEQIELREPSQVVLGKDSFTNSASIYVYKNFNDCDALEQEPQYEAGKRINNKYTLKDGEYIFYTDQNKAEFAYFTSGTEVTLTGKVRLPKFNTVDLATIFDSGIQDIPWYPIHFTANSGIALQETDGIAFQEYQYITLGPGDTLKDLTIVGSQNFLNEQWQYCDNISYVQAGADEVNKLPKINTTGLSETGSGWEASSLLELNASPSTSQTLRKTDKVETSLTLHKVSKSGGAAGDIELSAEDTEHPISFKPNLACQSSNGKVKISELYTNPNNLKSFEFKIFKEEAPTILKTEPGKLVPYHNNGANDANILDWPVDAPFVMKDAAEYWSQVDLTSLVSTDEAFDRALKLSISLIPNTYGIFSIYLKYSGEKATPKTWIELLPGMSSKDVTLFNMEDDEIVWETSTDGNKKLVLNTGLNCVRVNTTCDLYIKTSNDSEGIVYFDELRLVDALPIEYTENGQKKYQATQGLNLAQVGYLDTTANSTFNVFDMRVRRTLKNEYADAALAVIKEEEQKLDANFSTSLDTLITQKSKVQRLLSFIETAKQEVEAIYKTDSSDTAFKDETVLKNLVQNYKNICDDLEQEVALKTALENNTNIDELEQQLIELLGNFANIEESKQELLTELDTLRELAKSNAESFDSLQKEDVLDDFKASANAEADQTLVTKLKLASLGRINSQYNEQLALIANSLDSIANATSQTQLTTAVEKMHTKKHAELMAQVEALFTATQSDLSSALTDIHNAANNTTVDYNDVADRLVDLRTKVSNFNINNVVANIEFAANEHLYNNLAQAVENLRALLTAEDTLLIKAIDALLILVQAKLDANSTTADAKIIAAIASLKTDVYNNRNTQVTAILDEIDGIITEANSTYSSLLTTLKKAQDAQVKELAGQLESITTARNSYVAIVNNFGAADLDLSTDYAGLPFGEEAVLAIWPVHMKQALSAGVDQLYVLIRNTIKTLNSASVSLAIDERFYTDSTKTTERTILTNAANLGAFEKLFKQAKDLAFEYAQNSKRGQLIEQLGDIVPMSPELTTAMNAIKADSDSDRNAIICNLINQLQTNTTLAEKQQLIKALVTELDSVIQLDTKLVEVSAKFFSASIMLLEKTLPETTNDTFYGAVKTYIENAKSAILTSANINTSLGTILADLSNAAQVLNALVAALNPNTLEDFADWVDDLNVNNLSNGMLTADYLDKLRYMKELITSKNQLANVRECNLLSYLEEDLIVAWQDDDKWLDSAGNYYTQRPDGLYLNDKKVDVDVKRYTSGVWYDCSTGSDVEIKIKRGTSWLKGATAITVSNAAVNKALDDLFDSVDALGKTAAISEAFKEAYNVLKLEEQLLAEIRALDKNRDFYYNVPTEANVAIDFNEGDEKLNSLMNPAVNYDINNVNNSFVISKIDINHLTKGIQIARSSRIS